jgi:hypothetical protein
VLHIFLLPAILSVMLTIWHFALGVTRIPLGRGSPV